jgi:large subunit ribosomal protein L31e
MAKKKDEGPKVDFEREYTVPLRKGFSKVPEYKRANKAIKTLKEFLVKHMKVYDRDLRKIKLDIDLNNEIRFRGIRKPLAKVKVRAVKFEDGIVRVSLVDIPDHIKFARLREEKLKKIDKKKTEKKVEEKKNDDEDEEDDKNKEVKEKIEAGKEETMKIAKQQAKDQKHVSKDKDVKIQRKALSR